MSNFEVIVYEAKLEPHPNADTLECVRIGDYLSIVRKGDVQEGQLCAYIPEGALVPKYILEKIGMWDHEKNIGKLSGSAGVRVKAKKLRGILSQGLIYPSEEIPNKDIGDMLEYRGGDNMPHHIIVHADQNVTEILNIKKHEPTIPASMRGDMANLFGYTIKFDIENIRKYNRVLEDGETIAVTEKAHGTFCAYGLHPEVPHPIIHSKGLGGQGVGFKLNEANANNLYVKIFNSVMKDKFEILFDVTDKPIKLLKNIPIYFLGEIFGTSVQDLTYGQSTPIFRVFDIYHGHPGEGRYMDVQEKIDVCKQYGFDMVPLLYTGPYSKEIIDIYTNGKETVSGKQLHMREGIVITTMMERQNRWIGRVILKSVSEDYLLRKAPKGVEITEFA